TCKFSIAMSLSKTMACNISRRMYSAVQSTTQVPQQAATEKTADPLTDRFKRRHTYLRISLAEKCNLRCQYCMPAEGVSLTPSKSLLTSTEISRLARAFVSWGVRKVRLTGGEPLLRADLLDIVAGLNELRSQGLQSIGITTNGILLQRQARALRQAGLDALNVSCDTLVPGKFELVTRRRGWDRVWSGVRHALDSGFPIVKINCVAMRGFNDDELVDFVRLTLDHAYDVRFIEYMPFDGNRWSTRKMLPYAEMLDRIRVEFPNIERLPDEPNHVSKAWKVPGARGRVGFISSMTQHFCAVCNRVRVTADGNFKVCLHGGSEVSLRDAIRSGATDDELKQIVSDSLQRKKAQHAEKLLSQTNPTLHQIPT
ncbi:hypothetical protein BOX15_Mlig002786g1, partial [Macrostomum lignano]